MGTLSAVAKMGYQTVEFFGPYYGWTEEYARQVRLHLDELGMRCMSTHNSPAAISPEGLPKAIKLNRILGSTNVVLAGAPKISGLDGWKALADRLAQAAEQLKGADLRGGFHNHQIEFQLVEGHRPIEVIAAATPRDFMLQLDVGHCVDAGYDPVAWIRANPGRTRCIHCKDWAPGDAGYQVLFGEGVSPWSRIFEAAEAVGGVEFYLIEQEGSRFPPMETAERCLANWKEIRQHGRIG